jgi:hypothetical protein
LLAALRKHADEDTVSEYRTSPLGTPQGYFTSEVAGREEIQILFQE